MRTELPGFNLNLPLHPGTGIRGSCVGFYRDVGKLTLESGRSAAKYSESFLKNEKVTRELEWPFCAHRMTRRYALPSQTCRSVSVASDCFVESEGESGGETGRGKMSLPVVN